MGRSRMLFFLYIPMAPEGRAKGEFDRTGGAIQRLVIAAWGGSRAQTQLCPASSRSGTRALLRSVARRGSAREPREGGAVVDESRRAARCAAEDGRWLPNETRFQFREDTRPGSEESCANTLIKEETEILGVQTVWLFCRRVYSDTCPS